MDQDKVLTAKLSNALIELQHISDKAVGKGFTRDDIQNIRDITFGLYKATIEYKSLDVEPYIHKYTQHLDKEEG